MITCKVIRKVSGNSTVIYNGKTFPALPEPLEEKPTTTGRKVKRENSRKLTDQKPVQPAPEVVKKVALKAFKDYVTENPETGIPGEKDTFHVVTLHSNEHNGLSLPIDENRGKQYGRSVYPVYFVANQNGEIMRTVSDYEDKITKDTTLGWFYRSNGSEADGALDLVLKDVKRLKSWQRAHYSSKATDQNEVKLSEKEKDGVYSFPGDYLYSQISKVTKAAYLDFGGLVAVSAVVLRDIVRIAKRDWITLKIEAENMAAVITYQTDGMKVKSVIKACAVAENLDLIPVI